MSSTEKTSHRILVVDDNASIHEDFRKILTKNASNEGGLKKMETALFEEETTWEPLTAFEIDVALQGREALEMAQRARAEGRPYSLAFVDGRMPPGWDGIETIGHLWQELPKLQVVLCTAYADYSWQEIRKVLGESDNFLILKKPFDNIEVLQMAHALTRKWELNHEVKGRLNQLAFYDSLTGLPNRSLFLDRLSQTLEQARRYKHKSALMFIDMDNFKQINDTLGHGAGDDLLKITAKRLSGCLRTSDTVARPKTANIAARLGGDEFTVVLPFSEKIEDTEVVVKRISRQLAKPMDLSGHQVTVTPSIGVAIFPDDGDNIDDLLKNADLAMYFAKRNGPNASRFYDPSMSAGALKRLSIENHLREAIERDELSLNYQPQFDLRSGELNGMEALIRWNNWEIGNIPPTEFIPLAEENGMIIPIGEWVLKTACRQAAEWIAQGLPLKRMAVNLSVKQLNGADFLEKVRTILEEAGLEPNRLEIEITESLLEIDTPEFIDILNRLKEMDIRIAVDDFGNGYSNMSRLKDMPFNCIKIDRSFVNDIDCGKMNQSIVSAILTMAHAMGVRVIAEGIETSVQADFLRDRKCQEGQGFLFSKPLTKFRAESYLRRFQEMEYPVGDTEAIPTFQEQ